jgi:cytosine/creatinine deaminase
MTQEPLQPAAQPGPEAAPDAAFEAAYQAAQKSLREGGIPIGAALARDGVVIASGHNERVQNGDPIAHGEMSALRVAGRQKSYRDSTLYTTLAPCAADTLKANPIWGMNARFTYEGFPARAGYAAHRVGAL